MSADDLAQEGYVRAGLVLEDMELFDAGFFGFTPREAEIMDPQQRLSPGVRREALEAAGYAGEQLRGPDRRLRRHERRAATCSITCCQRPDLVRQLGLMQLLTSATTRTTWPPASPTS